MTSERRSAGPLADLLDVLRPKRTPRATKREMRAFLSALTAAGLFDGAWYLRRYGDVAGTDLDPLAHFLHFGRFEKRSPGPDFDAAWYAAHYGDAIGGIDPTAHYLMVGKPQGLHPLPRHLRPGRRVYARSPQALAAERERPRTQTRGILIRTYHADAFRLYFALRSIGKHCTGFDSLVVVCQPSSEWAIAPVVACFDFARLVLCEPYANDYIGQQITKLMSHTFVAEDVIFHVDSDCIFFEPTDLSRYMDGDVPLLFHRSYDSLYRRFVAIPWQEVTSRFMLRQVDHEFMCGFPFAYPRALYEDLHAWFVATHGFDYGAIEGHLLQKDAFSEFNLLGAFSFQAGRRYNTPVSFEETGFDFRMHQYCRVSDRNDRSISPQELAELESLTEYDPG